VNERININNKKEENIDKINTLFIKLIIYSILAIFCLYLISSLLSIYSGLYMLDMKSFIEKNSITKVLPLKIFTPPDSDIKKCETLKRSMEEKNTK